MPAKSKRSKAQVRGGGSRPASVRHAQQRVRMSEGGKAVGDGARRRHARLRGGGCGCGGGRREARARRQLRGVGSCGRLRRRMRVHADGEEGGGDDAVLSEAVGTRALQRGDVCKDERRVVAAAATAAAVACTRRRLELRGGDMRARLRAGEKSGGDEHVGVSGGIAVATHGEEAR